MNHSQDKSAVVLITGASTGIGLALARKLMSEPYRLVLTARSSSMSRFAEHGIEESASILLRSLDVTNPDEANSVIADICRIWGGVDILINNAGVAYRAVMEHLSDEDEEDQFHINYLGPLHLIRCVLPYMRSRRQGRIINISSVGGMMAMPTMGGYSASKFALEGASEALWYELKPWGIKVTLLEPGFVNSNSFQNAVFTPQSRNAMDDPNQPYHPYYTNLIRFIEKMMLSSPTTPEKIAAQILKIMRHRNPRLRVSATYDAVIFRLLRRILPQRLYHWVLYRSLPNINHWVPAPPEKEARSEKPRPAGLPD